MIAITQFEVYAFTKGRWTLHARYPGEDRNEAIMDARNTEAVTGFPTKVVRETYYPEVNNSETITAYISPKAKEAQQQHARQQAATAAVAQQAAVNARRGVRRSRPRLTVSQMFFRVVVAGGISLVAATMITGIVNWAMSWVAEAGGLVISPGARTTTLTYSYVLVFLYIFYSLFRSRLPLHRYLADLWQKAAKQAKPEVAIPVVNGKPPKVKPKHNRPPSPETLREWEELKVKRGDLDSIAPPQLPEPLPPVTAVTPAPPVAQPVSPPEKKAPEKTAIEKMAEAVEPPPSLEADKTAEAKRKEKEQKEKEKAAAEAAQAKKAAEKAEKEKKAKEEALAKDLNLERMVMRRFASDVVKPAIKSAMPDDPVARRGAAVVLAGGAAGVAATARLGANAELELLMDALRHIGMNQAAIDTFMSQHTQLVSAPANAGLLAAGRSALAGYLEGATDLAVTVARALAGWRTPWGPTAFVPFAANDALPLVDVYMMTELREDLRTESNETAIDAFHDRAMGAHNTVVRQAVAAHGGHEVKHTGKGIFARFTTATAAVDAAVDIQRHYVEEGSKLAIGIVGNTAVGEDTLLSDKLVRQAQAILSRTGAGEILCETQVRTAAQRQRPTEDGQENQDAEELDLVRLVVPEADFESPRQTGTTAPSAEAPAENPRSQQA